MLKGQVRYYYDYYNCCDLMRKRVDTIEETEIFSEGIRSIKKAFKQLPL